MKNIPNSNLAASAYSALVLSGQIREDLAQRVLVARLDRLIDEIAAKNRLLKSSSLGWLLNKRSTQTGRHEGVYIHGGVGRGKSMLMDMFFALAPLERKRRTHFNDFMADAHARISQHRKAFAAGMTHEADPIRPVGTAMAKEARLLCFDEFSITDIADAMIIGRLFSVLFAEGVVVVATSNVAPDDLYRDGINRQVFLPFISLVKQHCDVVRLEADADFRLEKLSRGDAYLSPLGPRADAKLKAVWKSVSNGRPDEAVELNLKGRRLSPAHAVGGAAWFTFGQLCAEPRAAADYLAIARRFNTVLVEGVPMMGSQMRNEAKRFILLVDTLYDQGLRAFFSAEANPHALYQGSNGTVAFEFRRTASRLIEMQSAEYLARFNGLITGTESGFGH